MANGTSTEEFLASLQQGVTQVSESFLGSIPAVQSATQSVAGFTSSVQAAHQTAGQITSVLNVVAQNQQRVTTTMRAAAAQMTAQNAGQRLVAAGTRIWSAAQRSLNNAFRANPIGFVISTLQYLITALITAYRNSQTFRNIVHAAFRVIRNVVTTVFDAIKGVVLAVWPYVQRVVTVVASAIRTTVKTSFTVVRTIVTTVFRAVRAIASAVWNGIRAIVTGAVNVVLSVVRRIVAVYTVIRNAFGRARAAVSGAIGAIVRFVRRLPGRAASALGNIASTLVDKGKDLIQGFLSGIESMAGNIIDTIKSFVTDRIPGFVQDALGIGSPSTVMAGLGEEIGEGLAVGIENSRRRVTDAMNRLIPLTTPRVAQGAAVGTVRDLTGGTERGIATALRRAGPTVNVHPRQQQSEEEIGRIAAREMAWAAKR